MSAVRHAPADGEQGMAPLVADNESEVRVLHDVVPGRLRIRIARLRGAATRYKVALEDSFERIHGVASARASVRTASVLLLFDASMTVAELLERIERTLGELGETRSRSEVSPTSVRPSPKDLGES